MYYKVSSPKVRRQRLLAGVREHHPLVERPRDGVQTGGRGGGVGRARLVRGRDGLGGYGVGRFAVVKEMQQTIFQLWQVRTGTYLGWASFSLDGHLAMTSTCHN